MWRAGTGRRDPPAGSSPAGKLQCATGRAAGRQPASTRVATKTSPNPAR